MDKAKRKAIIAGNWKMNKTASEAAVLVDELVPAVQDAGCEVVICVPFTDLVIAVEMTKGTNSLNFYYAKDTADWKGYEVSYLPIFKVLEVSNTVDEATAFALPPADFKAVANPSMRAYANRLLERQ